MKTKLCLITLVVLFSASCSKVDTEGLMKPEKETKYYTFDFVKIADMVGKSYNTTAKSLIDYKVIEENLAGIRISSYFLKDNENILSLEVQESSTNNVKKLIVEPSYMMYSAKEQLNMFVEYIKKGDSKLMFSNATYEDSRFHKVESVNKMIAILQDNPTLYKNNSFNVNFKKGDINIYVVYLSNKFGIIFE